MKQVLVHQGQIIIEDIPAPLLEEGFLLVEVAYSLLSAGTELGNVQTSGKSLLKRAAEQPDQVKKIISYFKNHGFDKTVARIKSKVQADTPLGYSCSGVVIQVGEGIQDFQPGDRVACAGAGYANHAEVVIVPKNLVVRVPSGCDLRSAASVTLGSIALQGIRRAQPQLGESVAVIGLGLLGQLTIQLLKSNGCQVVGIDLDRRRAEIAKSLGADFVLVPHDDITEKIKHFSQGHGVDATIITAASKSDQLVQQAMEITRKKGRVVIVGDVGLGLQRNPFYEKEIDLLISCSYGPGRYDPNYELNGVDYPYAYVRWTEKRNMQAYLALVGEGKIDTTSIIEKEYDISAAQQAYTDLKKDENRPIGIMLRYQPATRSGRLLDKRLIRNSSTKQKQIKGRIGIAVIGAGDFAQSVHLPNIKQLSDLFDLKAVVSSRGHNAVAVAKQFGAGYATTDYDQILSDSEIDAVIISTRHHLHAQQVIKALKAGKHVYCEKPLMLTREELDAILDVYGYSIQDFESGEYPSPLNLYPILTVGYNRRFSPAGIALKRLTSDRQNPLMAQYRVNAGLLNQGHWIHSQQGGGRILGEMCHMFDFFGYIVGARAREFSIQTLRAPADHINPKDNVSISILYDDGSICTLTYTSLGAKSMGKEYIETFVDGASAIIDDFKLYKEFGGSNIHWNSIIPDKGHQAILRSFGESMTKNRVWPIPLHELVDSALLSLAADKLTSKSLR